ncbi:MAG: hypothetical protein K9M17_03405 [Mariprofundaceae bacterium]|nr:hypothetical protein [Mariprofundaceae bacterium]
MKKMLIGVAVLLVIAVGGLVYVWSNLDSIVKGAIETYGSEATKTTVSVAEVKLELGEGKATISGLKVGNPAGFTDPNIFELGMISTKIDTSTVNQNPIIIDEIIISAPAVVYEINKSGLSNADALKKNLGAGSGGGKSSASSGGGEDLKMVIRKLVVEGTTAKVRIAALGNMEQSVKLPRIVMTDIGKKGGGATSAEVAQKLSSKMLGNVTGAVSKLGVDKYLGKSADLFKGAAGKLGETGGGAAEKVGGALKGLLGN